MERASVSRTEKLNGSYAGAIAPRGGSSGSLLTQYSLRLGNTLMRHRAQLAERASRIEAEMASQVKSEFITNISHELRTPLNSILGFSKMLKGFDGMPIEPAQVEEYADFILGSAESLLNIVNDIITISKLQSGKFHLDIDEADLEEMLRPCITWATGRVAGTVTTRSANAAISVNGDAEIETLTPTTGGTVTIADGKKIALDNSITIPTGTLLAEFDSRTPRE